MSEVNVNSRSRKYVQFRFIAAVAIALIIIANLSSSSSDKFSIQGVEIGDSYETIEEKLGIAQGKFSGSLYTYDGIEFSVNDSGKVDHIRTWSTDYRTNKKIGVGSTLAEVVDQYGNDKLRMSYGDVYAQLNTNQIIIFNMAAYDSRDLYDTTIVKSMEITLIENRNDEQWDSMRTLEYQVESN